MPRSLTIKLATHLKSMISRRLPQVGVTQVASVTGLSVENGPLRKLHSSRTLRPLIQRLRDQSDLRCQHASLSQAAGYGRDAEAVTAPEPGTPEAPPQVPPELASLESPPPTEEDVEVGGATRANAADVPDSFTSSSGVEGSLTMSADGVVEAQTAGSGLSEGVSIPLAAKAAPADVENVNQDFDRHWDLFMAKLQEKNMFNTLDDKGNTISAIGATKRASLEVGRQRTDLLFSLDPAKIKGLLSAYDAPGVSSAMDDRKCFNALKRLRASYLDEEDLGIAMGGAAESVDLTRVLWSTHTTTTQETKTGEKIQLDPAYLAVATDILKDMLVLLDSEPDAASVARAAEAKVNKEAVHEKFQAPRNEYRGEYRGDQGMRAQRGRFEDRENYKPGDWECPECQSHNFASKQACYRCGIPKPEGLRSSGGSYGGMRGDFDGGYGRQRAPASGAQLGDWPCPLCGTSNFARRRECFSCGEPRGADSGRPADQGWGARSGSEENRAYASRGPQVKPGDWRCAACSEHNFASRSECFRCGEPKPAGSEIGGSESSGSFSQRSYGGQGGDGYGRGSGDGYGRGSYSPHGGGGGGRGRAPGRGGGGGSYDRGGYGSRSDSYGRSRSDGPGRGAPGSDRGLPPVRGGNLPSGGRSGPPGPPPADLDW